MRTVQALAVTLLAPLGFVTTDAATDSIQPPAEEFVPEDAAAVVPAGPEVSSWPTVTVIGADATDRAVLDEALTAFRANGLELPDVEIRYSGDRADCNGHLGLFENWHTPWRLLVCTDAAYVTYHELAHAWEAANIDDDTRARYLEARNLSTWNDPDTPWADRGIEDVARLLQVSLMTKRPHLDSAIWQERLAAYELLTGRSSPALDRAVSEATTADPPTAATATATATTDDDAPARPQSDRTATYSGGIAARVRADGNSSAGDVFLLLATAGSDRPARVFDQTAYTHDVDPHPDAIESNHRAREFVTEATGHPVGHLDLATAPGGGPSGGLAYVISYLNDVTGGAFTGGRRVAATGELGAEGYLVPVTALNEKLAAARLADVDVLFTPNPPSHAALEAHADRHIGRRVRSRIGRVPLADERELSDYHDWGATAPSGVDVVQVGHVADVAAYLCGAGSDAACDISERLGSTITSDVPTAFDVVRTLTREPASSASEPAVSPGGPS